jgi:hypothetical protein
VRRALLTVLWGLAACGGDGAPGGGAADALADAVADGSAPDVPDAADVRGPDGAWRSALYPVDWSPASSDPEGRFLHDFSYAGYHNGAAPLPDLAGAVTLDVLDYGADPTGVEDATAPLQAALDDAGLAASPGVRAVVHVPAGTYRVDGRVVMHSSWVVLRGDGPAASRLAFSQTAGMNYRNHLQVGANPALGEDLRLAADADARQAVVRVADTATLGVGDDVALGWVITEPWVAERGMTGTWQAFNGTWQPFFRRTVVAIDRDVTPHAVTLDVPLRYPARVSEQASLRREVGVLREVGVESLGLANATTWEGAWALTQVHALGLAGVADAWVRDVATFASPFAPSEGKGSGAHLLSGGLLVIHAKRVTVTDTRLERAQNRGGGGNGYLFEIRQSSEVLFADCTAFAGRHNFIQNWGFGATGVVWLRVTSSGGVMQSGDPAGSLISTTGHSEFHHSLAMAALIDASRFDDGWGAVNRKRESSGAGHTATESVLWNTSGAGMIRSYQYGHGYVIGTAPELEVKAEHEPLPEAFAEAPELWWALVAWEGAEPQDWVEGAGVGATLDPPSLYEDQLARRLGR